MSVSVAKSYYLGINDDVNIKTTPASILLFTMAWLNSLPSDWIARFMIQINVSKTYLYRLPMPQPTDAEIMSNPDYTTLAKNALLLSLASEWDAFSELAPLFDIKKTQLPTTSKAYDKLRAENDRIVARLYGITPEEMKHLLKSFSVMSRRRSEYLKLLPA